MDGTSAISTRAGLRLRDRHHQKQSHTITSCCHQWTEDAISTKQELVCHFMMTLLLVGGPRAHLRFVLGRTQTHKDRSRRILGCAIYDQILRDRAIFGRRFVALKFLSLETGQLPYPLLRPPTEPGTYITQFSARHVSLGMARSGSFQRDANSIQFNSIQFRRNLSNHI